jgi:hypothetical protein
VVETGTGVEVISSGFAIFDVDAIGLTVGIFHPKDWTATEFAGFGYCDFEVNTAINRCHA